jgi:glycosyltransferase involved in cell wall biosynthesis
VKKQLSVVVVTYNRPRDLKRTVDSLLDQSAKPLEVIVIDDGSNPPLNIEFRSKNIKRIRFDKEVGLSNARNYGISIAKGEYIAFIDDDATADKCWLEEIQKGINVADILGGPIRPVYQAVPPEWWNEKDFGGFVGIGNAVSRSIWGCNMVVRKEAFSTVGLFNPNIGRQKGKLLGWEEIDFIDRATKKGLSAQFMPAAVVYHKVPPKRMTLNYIIRRNYDDGKSEKIREGRQPLRTYFGIMWLMFSTMASPRSIISGKLVRIRKILLMARLLGKLL